jgi:hypothetical protein
MISHLSFEPVAQHRRLPRQKARLYPLYYESEFNFASVPGQIYMQMFKWPSAGRSGACVCVCAADVIRSLLVQHWPSRAMAIVALSDYRAAQKRHFYVPLMMCPYMRT